jgi:hypothetical protein
MTARFFLVLVSAVSVASPALARNYYPVENTRTLKCYVLPKKPKTRTVMVLGDGTPYKTRSEARAALAASAACKPK